MNAAALICSLTPAQEPERVTVSLTEDEQAALMWASLKMAVQIFVAADRAEMAGNLDKADSLRHDALVLSRAELKLRRS